MNKSSKLFITILLLFSLVILFKLCLNSNEFNFVDNRMSYKFEKPTIKTILSGEYQESVANAIADQLPKYNYFKLIYLKIANYTNYLSVKLFKLDHKNKYINFDGINLYKDYLIYTPTSKDNMIDVSKDDLTAINNLTTNTNANIYFYFVDSDYNHNFEDNTNNGYLTYLIDNLNIPKENISYLDITDFKTYQKYFYKTDHHWNHLGSYKGYTDIANLMNFNNILTSNEEYCYDNIPSYGSKSKQLAGLKILNETICLYTYTYPNLQFYNSNEELAEYGSTLAEIESSPELSYAGIYGGDYPELIINNLDSSNGKKLLIYSNSYSNAVNKLLASEYQNTYIIDGRYYDETSMVEYINSHEIDDVLILANDMLLWDDIKW